MIALLACLLVVGAASAEYSVEELMVKKIEDVAKTQNKFIVPRAVLKGKGPVDIQLWVQEFNNITPRELELFVYLNVIWNDARLRWDHAYPEHDSTNITMPLSWLDGVWSPAVQFIDTRDFEFLHAPARQGVAVLFANGTIWKNIRARITVPCNRESASGKKVSCGTSIESYLYNSGKVSLRWGADLLVISQGNIDARFLGGKQTKEQMKYPAGLWDQLTVKMEFEMNDEKDCKAQSCDI